MRVGWGRGEVLAVQTTGGSRQGVVILSFSPFRAKPLSVQGSLCVSPGEQSWTRLSPLARHERAPPGRSALLWGCSIWLRESSTPRRDQTRTFCPFRVALRFPAVQRLPSWSEPRLPEALPHLFCSPLSRD